MRRPTPPGWECTPLSVTRVTGSLAPPSEYGFTSFGQKPDPDGVLLSKADLDGLAGRLVRRVAP